MVMSGFQKRQKGKAPCGFWCGSVPWKALGTRGGHCLVCHPSQISWVCINFINPVLNYCSCCHPSQPNFTKWTIIGTKLHVKGVKSCGDWKGDVRKNDQLVWSAGHASRKLQFCQALPMKTKLQRYVMLWRHPLLSLPRGLYVVEQ